MYLAHSFPPLHTGLVNYPAPIGRGEKITDFQFPKVLRGQKCLKITKNCDEKEPPKLTGFWTIIVREGHHCGVPSPASPKIPDRGSFPGDNEAMRQLSSVHSHSRPVPKAGAAGSIYFPYIQQRLITLPPCIQSHETRAHIKFHL